MGRLNKKPKENPVKSIWRSQGGELKSGISLVSDTPEKQKVSGIHRLETARGSRKSQNETTP